MSAAQARLGDGCSDCGGADAAASADGGADGAGDVEDGELPELVPFDSDAPSDDGSASEGPPALDTTTDFASGRKAGGGEAKVRKEARKFVSILLGLDSLCCR